MSDNNPAASSTSAPAPVPSVTFKKKSRKEFRKPAQSLAARSNLPEQQASNSAAAAAATALLASSSTAPATAEPAVQIEDESVTSTAPPTTTSGQRRPRATLSDSDNDSESDDDDPSKPRRSIALSAEEAAKAAAAIHSDDPEQDEAEDGTGDDGTHVKRPTKRARKENPLLGASTRRVTSNATEGLSIASKRTAERDESTVDHRVAMEVQNSSSTMPAASTAKNKPKWAGPQKPMAANVRMISRFDYQPDVCKDYKETGRCGWGDSCKFLHDRGDYKAGWELERDWVAEQEAKRKKLLNGKTEIEEPSTSSEDDLPWACLICKGDFKNPVVTRCKHYYCEKCALDHYVKDTKCFACKAQTSGIFNTATELIAAIKRRAATGHDPRKALQERERQQAEEKAKRTGEEWAIP